MDSSDDENSESGADSEGDYYTHSAPKVIATASPRVVTNALQVKDNTLPEAKPVAKTGPKPSFDNLISL